MANRTHNSYATLTEEEKFTNIKNMNLPSRCWSETGEGSVILQDMILIFPQNSNGTLSDSVPKIEQIIVF